MCKTPLRIKNNSKYITDNNGHQYYIWVNCGHCDECITQKQNEWTLRTFYQLLDTIQSGYCYFDTLTYRNETLPRITNFVETENNWACFNPKHIREFYEKLRYEINSQLDIAEEQIKYFITSEYGAIRNRPHYHVLLFIYEDLDNNDKLELSRIVAESWKYGRTDGIPYKSRKYVQEHNIINNMNLNAIRYVSKYVTKSQTHMKVINARWQKLENYYKHSKYNKLQIKKIKKQYYRHTTCFHRESRGYGETALFYIDDMDLILNNRIYYKDDSLNINKYVSLPMYYKRKLFQKQIKVNGKRIWVNTEAGIKFKTQREEIIIDKITQRYKDLARQKGIEYTDEKLRDIAHYILLERGRLKGKEDYKNHINEAKYFNYNTDKDLIYLGKKTISTNFAGNDKIGYCTTEIEPIEIENQVYINNHFEAIINELGIERDNISKTLLKEHMNEIKKIFFPNLLK